MIISSNFSLERDAGDTEQFYVAVNEISYLHFQRNHSRQCDEELNERVKVEVL